MWNERVEEAQGYNRAPSEEAKALRYGFTGTRDGMTDAQHQTFCALVKARRILEFHHGCCLGADAEALEVVQTYAPEARTVAHPPLNQSLLSSLALSSSSHRCAPRGYLERDRDIVDESDHLFATPKQDREIGKSGTWATVRMARRAGKPVTVIWPDGSVSEE